MTRRARAARSRSAASCRTPTTRCMYQTMQANQALQLVYTGLVTYKHAEGAEGAKLIPGLAEALPTISADKKTYTFKLREGLKYSDGTAVKASDFEHTIKRLNYLGGPFSSFTAAIDGRPGVREGPRRTTPTSPASPPTTRPVRSPSSSPSPTASSSSRSRLRTPRRRRPRSRRSRPTRTSPAPGRTRSTIQNPTREYTLTQTPGFDVPGIPKGNFDKITVVKSTVPEMTQDVINNKLDFMTEDPTGDLLPQVKAKYPDRFRHGSQPAEHVLVLPQRDGAAVQQARGAPGGQLRARQPRAAAHLRRPARADVQLPAAGLRRDGYKKIDPCPYGDPAGPGDIAKAKAARREVRHQGPDRHGLGQQQGPAPGDHRVPARPAGVDRLQGEDEDPRPAGVLRRRSATRRPRPRPASRTGSRTSRIRRTSSSRTCPKAALASNPTFNFQFKSNPVVDKALEGAGAGSDPATVADEWAEVDKSVIEQRERGGLRQRAVDVVLLGADGRRRTASGVSPVYKNDWSAVLPEVAGDRGRAGRARERLPRCPLRSRPWRSSPSQS